MKVALKSNLSWLNCSLRVLHRQRVKNDSVLRIGEPKNRHNSPHNRNKCVTCPTRFLHRSTVITTDSGGLMLGTSSSCAIALKFLEQKSFAQGLLMIYDETWRFGSSNHLGVFVSMLSLTTRRSAADFYFCGIVSASWLSGLHRTNSSWLVWKTQQQLSIMLEKCWPPYRTCLYSRHLFCVDKL